MKQECQIELNFFYLHFNDAKQFLRLSTEAEIAQSALCSLYVRHAIIAVVFASEALINRVLAEFSTDPTTFEALEKNKIVDKWYLAPLLCARGSKQETFDRATEPFQSFAELVKIRNWVAHPQVGIYFTGTNDSQSSIKVLSTNEKYPWLEMLKGEEWPQSKIPKNPFELRSQHAKLSIDILSRMICKLSEKVDNRVTKDWLNLISIRDSNGVHSYKAPVQTIWDGYGGAAY